MRRQPTRDRGRGNQDVNPAIADIAKGGTVSPLGLQLLEGTNDTARSDESIESSGIVMPADQLGTSQSLPDFSQPPVQSNLDDQLENIKIQALDIQSAIEAQKTPTDTVPQGDQALDFKGQIQQGLTNMFNTDVAGDTQGIRDYYGLADKEKLSRDLNNEATAIKRDYEERLREARKNPDGKLKGAIQMQMDDITYDGNLLLSEKMFQYSIANGDFQQAEKLAQQAISDMEKRDARQLQLLQTAWNFVQNDLSESEKLQITQEFETQKSERDFEQSQYMAEFNYSLGAGQRAFNNNLAERDMQMKEAEFALTLQDRAQELADLANAGQPIPFANTAQVQQAETDISFVEDLTAHSGLKKAVGVGKLARFTPFKVDVQTGEVSDFTAKIDLMTKEMTLDNLIQAKEEGATFGALSDAELGLLADSASVINNWRRTKDNGDVYYKASEKKFREELDNITNYRKLDYVLRGGEPASVGVTVSDDGKYWAKNSNGSMTEIIRLPDNQ